MKYFVQVCVIAAIIGAACSASSTWGVRNDTDITIVTQKLFYYPALRNGSQTIFYDIPEAYQSNNRIITAMYVQDKFRNSSGPTNTLVSGGPGWTFASIQMRTQPGFGLNVTVVAYGKLYL
ncbi:uncharacterized protein [Eurosta solidaginis]|uniref:uncharacterized protein n=1 Tax=Eurosta solidaginis TaxID=178769 RepID=UPI0035312221